ncbi:MAG: asparagine--tRNA ligase [Spirochaetia bacterium]
MERTRVREALRSEPGGRSISVAGWVRTKRTGKNVVFLEVNDGSSLSNIQIVVDSENAGLGQTAEAITTGSSVRATGELVESMGKNQKVELRAVELELVGDAPGESYPLQKKRHSFEYLREIAHLRPRTNTFGAVARVRSYLSFAIHRYLQERGFLYVHTPLITASDAEGAGELFQVTTLDLESLARGQGAGPDYTRDFFGRPAYLTVSGQLNVETYASALDRAYTFGPTFRAENSNTTRHLSEFWMIEPEVAFCDIQCNMDLAEDFLKTLIAGLLADCGEDMEFFDKRIEPGIVESLSGIASSTFTRISYSEAVNALQKSNVKFEFPVGWGVDLHSEHEKFLTEEVFHGPIIVTDYPKEIKAFYMRLNDDEKTVRAMDVLVPRLGEIVGGSQREDRFDVLQGRIREMGLPEENYWWYLDLRRFGSVPHSGFGLGLARFIQYCTGMTNIRDVVPFPRAPGNASF